VIENNSILLWGVYSASKEELRQEVVIKIVVATNSNIIYALA
jgi:hypothetical protein